MILSISPASSLSFSGALPADPFVSQTALTRALVADGTSTLQRLADDGDTLLMIEAMKALGCSVQRNGDATIITPPDRLAMPDEPIPLGNAAYVFRLLTGVLAGAGVTGRLEAEIPLARRNIERLLGPLRSLGAEMTSSDRGTPPVYFFPGELKSGRAIDLPIANAYMKSALIAAARSAGISLTITEPRPSRDHAERIFEGEISEGEIYQIDIAEGKLPSIEWALPSDTLLADHLTTLAILSPASSIRIGRRLRTPVECRLLDLLIPAGAAFEHGRDEIDARNHLQSEPTADLLPSGSTLAREIFLDGERTSALEMEIPLLATAIAAGGGRIEVHGAMNLRQQICDRIAAIVDNLAAVGIETEEFDDGFRATGSGHVRGGCEISAYDDPVIALAMITLLSLADSPSILHDVPDEYRCNALVSILGVSVVEG